MEICDMGVWFFRDAPDLYFIVEARNQANVRMVYGSARSVHWFRTETWWNSSPAAMNGKTINLVSATADSTNAWRVWERTNAVYNWHAQAMASDYPRLPLNVLFPANDLLGIANASRAAFGEIQLLGKDFNSDHTLFHEFGHQTYYMNVLGQQQYINSMPAGYMASGTFPLCTDCMSHSLLSSKGEQYGMIEGWADFFEAVAFRNVAPYAGRYDYIADIIENPDNHSFQEAPHLIPTGAGNEVRVASYLYDLYDNDADSVFAESGELLTTDGDAVSPVGSAQARYRNVAKYAFGGHTDWGLTTYWFNKIKPTLSAAELVQHCKILVKNKLNLAEPACTQ